MGMVLCLLLASCSPTEGALAAVGTGDIIDEPLARVSEGFEPCGPPVSPASSLSRLPYVQRTTENAATIRWVSSGAPERVALGLEALPVLDVASEDLPSRYASGGTLRRVRFESLEPGTLYCYSLVSEDGDLAFGPVHFRTASLPEDDTPIQAIVFGDSGDGGNDQTVLAAEMLSVPADLVLHTGDVVYPSGSASGIERYVFDVYAELFQTAAFFPSFGNHDVETSGGAPALEAYELPTNGDGAGRYYSFDNGAAHFVALDTTRVDATQVAWLDADLAATDRPWSIVYGHHPAKSGGMHGDTAAYNELIVPVLERHGVDLALAGHDHHYERFRPLNGVTYVVTGAGGKSTRSVTPGPDTEFAEAVTHFLAISVETSTLRVWAVDATGRVFDSLELTE